MENSSSYNNNIYLSLVLCQAPLWTLHKYWIVSSLQQTYKVDIITTPILYVRNWGMQNWLTCLRWHFYILIFLMLEPELKVAI